MSVYLIDYENVNQKGLNGLTQLKLTENDKVVIYYSNNANSLTFELHNELMRSAAKTEYHRISCEGKNALDFILVCELGRYTAQNPDEEFYIVSKDTDYDNVIKYIIGHYHVKVSKIKSVSANINNSVCKKEEAQSATQEPKLSDLVQPNQYAKVEKIVNKYVTKNAIHNNLVKAFGENGKTIYETIKPLLKGKK